MRLPKHRNTLRWTAVAVVAGAALFTVGAASAAKPERTLASFTTPGTYQWQVPRGVRQVTFDVFGAAGGNGFTDVGFQTGGTGGKGGEVKATFAVEAGQWFEIVVGGEGASSTGSGTATGGVNGDQDGASYAAEGGDGQNDSGGGGGASDVRGGACAAFELCGLSARLVVAGGGGGGGATFDTCTANVNGGAGGGINGGAGGGVNGGAGGTQTTGSSFGAGGDATENAGGGGGGWYGGFAGEFDICGGGFEADGGGGGSGYIDTTHPQAVSGSFSTGVRSGNGMVVILKP